MTISIGYGKTYDWSKGTSNSLNNTFITTPTSQDGWLILDEVSPDNSKTWDILTGWTAAGASTSIVSNLLRQTAAKGNDTYAYKTFTQSAGGSFTITELRKMSVPSSNNVGGSGFLAYNGARECAPRIWKNGSGNYQVTTAYGADGGDSGVPFDTTRFHKISMKVTSSDNTVSMFVDGIQIASGVATFAESAVGGTYAPRCTNGTETGVTVTHDVYNTFSYNTLSNFITTDATWTSTYDDAIYDAGSDKKHKALTWTADTSNGTNIIVKCRCASSTAGLSSAVYETLTSGVDIVNKDRYIQIEITLQDAGSGQYTPILKTLDGTTEDSALPLANVFMTKLIVRNI